MTRPQRVLRGLLGAVVTILVAALSHLAAGGSAPSVIGIAAALVVAAAVCTVFAGRTRSLWRVSVAVMSSQALFHFFFSYVSGPASIAGAVGGAHQHGVSTAQLQTIGMMSSEAAMATHPAWMWVAHAFAAVLTIAMLRRGEEAILTIGGLLRMLLGAIIIERPLPVHINNPSTATVAWRNVFVPSIRWMRGLRYRGPPSQPVAS